MPLLFIHPKTGPIAEPPVSNREFLDGFVRYGAWLRLIKAVAHVDVLRDKRASELQRLAAVTGLYEQAGLQAEDTVTNLIAWSLWRLHRELLLADIMQVLAVGLSNPETDGPEEYCRKIQRQFEQSPHKRLRINAASYLQGLPRDGGNILPALGIPWKRNPSVRACPPGIRPTWDVLPSATNDLIGVVLGKTETVVSESKNKLKHGPQICFEALRDGATRRGIELPEHEKTDARVAARILLEGARRQETTAELASGHHAAPYLVDNVSGAEEWLATYLIHVANITRLLATFLSCEVWRGQSFEFQIQDEYVYRLIGRQADFLGIGTEHN
jgi:hypothetical protein